MSKKIEVKEFDVSLFCCSNGYVEEESEKFDTSILSTYEEDITFPDQLKTQMVYYKSTGDKSSLFSDCDPSEASEDFYVILKKTTDDYDVIIIKFNSDISILVDAVEKLDTDEILSISRIAVENNLC